MHRKQRRFFPAASGEKKESCKEYAGSHYSTLKVKGYVTNTGSGVNRGCCGPRSGTARRHILSTGGTSRRRLQCPYINGPESPAHNFLLHAVAHSLAAHALSW